MKHRLVRTGAMLLTLNTCITIIVTPMFSNGTWNHMYHQRCVLQSKDTLKISA